VHKDLWLFWLDNQVHQSTLIEMWWVIVRKKCSLNKKPFHLFLLRSFLGLGVFFRNGYKQRLEDCFFALNHIWCFRFETYSWSVAQNRRRLSFSIFQFHFSFFFHIWYFTKKIENNLKKVLEVMEKESSQLNWKLCWANLKQKREKTWILKKM
jgi:hypothetical protein